MNRSNSLFKYGNYQVFVMPETETFNIYLVDGVEMELMAADFLSLADAMAYILHP